MRFAGAALTLLLLAGCGGFDQAALSRPAVQLSGGSGAAVGRERISIPQVAGTYRGRYSETIGKTNVKGIVTIVIHQSGASIAGKFQPLVKGIRYNLGLKGRVEAIPHGARLHFTILAFGGRNARARAFVIGRYFYGRGLAPADDGEQAVHMKFRSEKE
jgi:hypothetical protein